ncbi:MAG: carboxymuconolactone decarboxylase family protein [Pseudomonadota bacterium]
MANSAPVQHAQTIPHIMQHLGRTHGLLRDARLDPNLSNLIELRISQINGCAYCVKMHASDARKAGERNERLDRLAVWRHVSDFSEAEKAAFAWAEALTSLDLDADYRPLRTSLREHYSDEMISLITTSVAMINLWNRVQASTH